MNDHEDLTDRLNALGRQPVDPALASRHLTAMATAPHGRNLLQRLRIVGAFTVGVLVGTTGLASAGALPGGMQEVAHDTLGAVGVNVPRADRYQGAECGGPVKNHGQYVKAQPKEKRAEAAASRCGKPVQAGADGEEKPKADGADGAGGECRRPVWAGRGKPSQAEKDARKAACGGGDAGDKAPGAQADKPAGPDHDGAEAGPAAEDPAGGSGSSEPPAEVATTTTTAAPETTTTTTVAPPADTGEAPVVPELPVPDPTS